MRLRLREQPEGERSNLYADLFPVDAAPHASPTESHLIRRPRGRPAAASWHRVRVYHDPRGHGPVVIATAWGVLCSLPGRVARP
jgi:hypothetical protein